MEPRADRRRRGAGRAGAAVAAVRAVHAAGGDRGGARRSADAPSATDWAQIVGLYDVLLRVDPSPVVELNRAAAVAMRDGPEAGPRADRRDPGRGELADYHLAHSARADLCRRLGRTAEARAPTSARWRWRGRSRSAGSWRDAGLNWTEGRKRSSGRHSAALAQPTPSGQL